MFVSSVTVLLQTLWLHVSGFLGDESLGVVQFVKAAIIYGLALQHVAVLAHASFAC